MPKLPDSGLYHRIRDAARRRIEAFFAADYPAPFTVPVNEVWGHCYTTATDTRAVYLLRDAGVANQIAGTQAQIRDLQTAALGSLIGRHVRIRTARMPLNPDPWAINHIRSSVSPAGEGGADLIEHVFAGAERQREPWMSEVVATIDVRLCGASNGVPDDGWETHDTDIIARLSGDGLRARRAPEGLIDWLIRTSAAPGHVIARPGIQRPAEVMAEYAAEVEWHAPIGARMVRISRVGAPDQWAIALTISTMTRRSYPGGPPPWMAAVQALDFDAQLVVSGRVIDPKVAAPKFEKRARWQKDQIEHQTKAGAPVEDSTVDTYGEARQLADRLKNGEDVTAVVEWVGRVVVTGPSPDVVAARARTAIKVFDTEQHITLAWERDQVTALNELMPGVREIERGFHRCSEVDLWSAGVVNDLGDIGQATGMDLGYPSGRQRNGRVRFDLWYPIEVNNRAAIYPVLGDMGAGRSTLGLRAIWECILLGVPAVAIDPAGEWTHVDRLPGAPGRVQIIDLSGRTAAMTGLLALRQLIPDPDPTEFTVAGVFDRANYEAALGEARHERVAAAIDAMRSIFDRDTWMNETRREAIKDAAWDCDGDLWKAVDWLNRPDEKHTEDKDEDTEDEDTEDEDTGRVTVTNPGGCEANRRLARELTSAAQGSARLLFPPRGETGGNTGRGLLNAQVTVITMRGMRFPQPGSDQNHWTAAERSAALIMRLTAYLGQRIIEEHDRLNPRGRKLLLVDEAGSLANWDYGVTWISGGVRHSRRLNCPYMLMSQHPQDLARLDPEGKVFSTGGFAGWHDKPEPATGSLALTGAPAGLEAVVTSLTLTEREDEEDPGRLPGEFLFTDADRRTGRIRVDLGPYPALAVEANTTPGQPQVLPYPEPQAIESVVPERVAVDDVYGPTQAKAV